VTIVIDMGTTADAGDDQVVSCDPITIGGDNPTATEFLWTTLDGEAIADPTTATIDVTTPGTYTLQITDANGCSGTDSVEVTGSDGLDAQPRVTNPECIGDEGVVLISSTSSQTDLQYSIDGGLTFSDSGLFENIAPGSYTMVVKDASGCEVTATFIVNAPEEIAPENFAGMDRQVDLGEDMYAIEAGISIDKDSIALVTWIDNETGVELCVGSYDDCGTIMVNPDVFNEYCVTLVDVNGCVVEDCVILREQLVRDVYIPNVFDPDEEDPANRTFHVHADRFVEAVESFNVYDRWGELVFSAAPNSLPNDPSAGWNGRWNNDGNNVEQGVYVYVIEVRYVDSGNGVEKEIFAGDITIIR